MPLQNQSYYMMNGKTKVVAYPHNLQTKPPGTKMFGCNFKLKKKEYSLTKTNVSHSNTRKKIINRIHSRFSLFIWTVFSLLIFGVG